MAIARSGTPKGAAFAAGTSIVVTLPTGLTDGDLILLNFNTQAAGNDATIAAAGWTRHAASGQSGGGVQNWLFWKVFATGDPTTVTVANSVSSNGGYQTAAYSGVNTTAPLGTASVSTNASSTALNVASMTTTKANSYGIVCCGAGSGSVTISAFPSGYSDVIQGGSGQKLGDLCDQSFPTAGTNTGALSYTLSVAAQGSSIQVELFAAAAAPSPQRDGTPLANLVPGLPGFAPPTGPTQAEAVSVQSAPPSSQFLNPLAPPFGLGLYASQQPYFPPLAGVTYTDAGTGTLNLSGSSTESHSHTSSSTGSFTLTGTRTESHSHSSSATGSFTITGTRTESLSASDARSGTLTLSGTRTESASHSVSATGTLTLSGSGTDTLVYGDSRSITLTLGGTSTESASHTGARTGTLILGGTGVEGGGVAVSTSLLYAQQFVPPF